MSPGYHRTSHYCTYWHNCHLNLHLTIMMQQLSIILLVALSSSRIMGNQPKRILSQRSIAFICGDTVNEPGADTSISCSRKCVDSTSCRAILYKHYGPTTKRCKLVPSSCTCDNYLKLAYFPGYEYYIVDENFKDACTIALPGGGTILPDEWSTRCPKIYQSFDSSSLGTISGKRPV